MEPENNLSVWETRISMVLEEITATFKDAHDLISKVVEKFAWLLFDVLWALMITFFVLVTLYTPGPVSLFYRYPVTTTILFTGGIIGFLATRFLRA